MFWDGVSCRLALLVNTIPFECESESNSGTPFGPATAFWRGHQLWIGNFGDGATNPAITLTFRSAVGSEQNALYIELPYALAFSASPWLERYANGWATVGTTHDDASPTIWVFEFPERIADGESVTANLPQLSLQFQLRAAHQRMDITARGDTSILRGDYMAHVRNTAARTGMRSGSLRSDSDHAPALSAALPTGIDFRDGLEHLLLQIPATTTPPGTTVNPAEVEMFHLSAEEIAEFHTPPQDAPTIGN
ncbi:hypothetical protein [Micromonospora sp. KC723]|uniref:hypothetical protein n=1 Tax=Micromonospora sp. KC723 TaxID=2530381 RepID=UPI001051070A|nr:hypothetical protein [Micromonospora sp. KC723]TDB74408.1 hypothetical protein E1165_14650 [Micromonospora sp. KC723]